MENNEVIRLNIKVHPDKDPALYQLLVTIAKEARSRRLMNLASTGLLMEQNGIVAGSPLKPMVNGNYQDGMTLSSVEEDTVDGNAPVSNQAIPPVVDEDELNIIGNIFGNS